MRNYRGGQPCRFLIAIGPRGPAHSHAGAWPWRLSVADSLSQLINNGSADDVLSAILAISVTADVEAGLALDWFKDKLIPASLSRFNNKGKVKPIIFYLLFLGQLLEHQKKNESGCSFLPVE